MAVTAVDFHTGVADKLGYTCRLVRKAWRSGRHVVVVGAGQELARLDQQLWTFDPGEFLPHVRLRPGQPPTSRLARTPVWLVEQLADAPVHDVLVNIGALALDELGPFARVIDVVAQDAPDVAAARQRWRGYQALGLSPTNLAVGPRAAAQDD